jgi:phospholipid-binding lipoprotein MlaA
MNQAHRVFLTTATVVLSVLASGCATVPPTGATTSPTTAAGPNVAPAVNPIDPWENWNRKVFAVNEAVDNAVLKPVATAYRSAVPSLVRAGVGNVFGNIGDVWSAANHFLQGKVQSGLEMGMRVLTNSFIGLGGLLDPATEMGLTRRSEDFGQTLGKWGVGSGPYMVLPLFGPSTVRDTAGRVVDSQGAASRLPDTTAGSVGVTALELLNTRSELLSATKLLDQIALDKYGFVRDAYLARRRDALFDGAAPLETFEDEPADPPAKAAPKVPAKPALKTAP